MSNFLPGKNIYEETVEINKYNTVTVVRSDLMILFGENKHIYFIISGRNVQMFPARRYYCCPSCILSNFYAGVKAVMKS